MIPAILRIVFPTFFVVGGEVTVEEVWGVISPAIGSALIAGVFLTVNTLIAVWLTRRYGPWEQEREHEHHEHQGDRRKGERRQADRRKNP